METMCTYYQAHIKKECVLYVVSILKSFEHLCYDRSIDKSRSMFEFFVPSANERAFLALMNRFEREGIVADVRALPNRLAQPGECL